MRKPVRFSAAAFTLGLFAWPPAMPPIAHAAETRTAWLPSGTLIPLPAKQANTLRITKTAKLPASPLDKDWTAVLALRVAVQPQQMTAPSLAKATISALDVQAVTGGRHGGYLAADVGRLLPRRQRGKQPFQRCGCP